MKITLDLFEANLKCATKCWLRSHGEAGSGNLYAEWVRSRTEAYRKEEAQRLLKTIPPSGRGSVTPVPNDFNAVGGWLAADKTARVRVESWDIESCPQLVEHFPSRQREKPAEVIPIRFVFSNKLGRHDRLSLAYDAWVLSKVLKREIGAGKIVYGDGHAALKVNTSHLAGEVWECILDIQTLLTGQSPPDLVLNRHCAECEFRNRCLERARETDDLSLLTGMSKQERARHRSRGIFTVTQLSYTFRPRRTPKRAKHPAKPHHFSLQALAIREKAIYIHGTPQLPDCQSRVYLDIEGLPDRDFYYLIGALVVTGEREAFHSFWADSKLEEAAIFTRFANLVSLLADFRVFHFGDYETAAIRRVSPRLPAGVREQFDAINQRSTNVLSLVYPHVYFPTFSNSLKELARCLGDAAASPVASGLHSIIWRHEWEAERTDGHGRLAAVRRIRVGPFAGHDHGALGGANALVDFIELISAHRDRVVGEGQFDRSGVRGNFHVHQQRIRQRAALLRSFQREENLRRPGEREASALIHTPILADWR
jgi:predicted RecB family nuclease